MSQRPGTRSSKQELNIALCVPLGGAAGIWGPSALASARLAVAELNSGSGITGRPCRLITLNAGDDAQAIEDSLVELVEEGDRKSVV